jgi:hypothetical protein
VNLKCPAQVSRSKETVRVIARLTHGAYCCFDPGVDAQELAQAKREIEEMLERVRRAQ